MAADLELLRRYAATRDASVFADLAHTYADMVFGTCLRILCDRAEAEDAAQECFWRLARESASIRISVGAWLHRCATNEAITRKRRRTTRLQRERDHESERIAQQAHASEWAGVSVAVDQALDALPDDVRALLVAHFLQRRTQAELARDLNISPATMSRRIAEGIDLLRKRLKSLGIVASVALLASLLARSASAAPLPSTLIAGLGKIALAGPAPRLHFWAHPAIKLAATCTGATAAAVIVWLLFRPHGAAPLPMQPAVAMHPPTAAVTEAPTPVPSSAYVLLYRLRNALPSNAADDPIAAVRQLVDLGPSALPAVTAELDRTTREDPQRLLILALRLINDPAAVPSLARALPHLSTTALPYAITLRDPDLRKLLQRHPTPNAPAFAPGTSGLQPALTECLGALAQLTGHAEPSRAAWIAWCSAHYPAGATPPPQSPDLVLAAGLATLGPPFPTGPQVALSDPRQLTLEPSNCLDAPAFADLAADTALQFNQHGQNNPDADLRAVPGNQSSLQGLGLAVWPVDNARFDTLSVELHLNGRLDLGTAGPALLDTPADQPRTFLFITRDKTRGILQLDPAAPGQPLHLRYRLISTGRTVHPSPATQAPAPRERVFSAVHEAILADPSPNGMCAIDLDTDAGCASPPGASSVPPTDATLGWLRSWGGDILTLSTGDHPLLAGDHLIALPVTDDAWDNLTAADIPVYLSRRDPTRDDTPVLLDPAAVPAAGIAHTWIFQTREGAQGVLCLEPASAHTLRLRYKLSRQN